MSAATTTTANAPGESSDPSIAAVSVTTASHAIARKGSSLTEALNQKLGATGRGALGWCGAIAHAVSQATTSTAMA